MKANPVDMTPWNSAPPEKLQGVVLPARRFTYWKLVIRQFRKNRLAIWSLRFVIFLFVIAFLADVLANEKPLLCQYQGKVYAPVFRNYGVQLGLLRWPAPLVNAEWGTLAYDWAVHAPIPYQPQNLDKANEHGVSPFAHQHVRSMRWRHWMGTDELGRDVLAGMLHGTRVALMVGIASMGLALIIGLLLGALAGFFGDEGLRISRARLLLNVLSSFPALFYAFGSRGYALQDALADSVTSFLYQLFISLGIFIGFGVIGNSLAVLFKRIPILNKKVRVPIDLLISRLIEIMVSIPILFLIISVSAIVTKPSLLIVMVLIGLTGWTGIARLVRAELLRIRHLEYIEAARSLGFRELRILLRHALPNALTPVLIAFAFGVAGAILTESLLSFLGIGVPAETITWGSMLSMARETPSAWWLALFPGFAIFLTVTTYNLLGEGLTDAMDPRKKN